MKVEALKKRLDRNRPMTTITIRIPEDVIEDLKRVAPLLGFSGYQPLVRAYNCTPTEYLTQRGFHPCHIVLPD
jgi:hypothetical protein